MIKLIANFSFAQLGWALLQFVWISTLYLGGMALVWKILEKFGGKLEYNIGLGALLALPFIPGLLFVEHNGILPPIGLADWDAPAAGQAAHEPLLQELPHITGFELAPSFYYWLGIIWAAVACLLVGYYLFSLIVVRLKCRKRPPLNNQKIEKLLKQVAGDSDIKPKFEIKKSGFGEGPAVAGIVRPVFLIPEALTEHYSNDEIKALLLHELIHIKRKDNLFAFLQHIIRSLFFFQPLVWWFNRKISREREHLCDRAVTQMTNDSHTYGNTLVKLQLQTQAAMPYSMSMADKNIVQRIKRLADTNKKPLAISQKISRALIALLITAITLFCTFWNSYHLHHVHNPHLQSTEDNLELVMDRLPN